MWEDELKNIDQNIKHIFKDRVDMHPILSRYRQLTKITPFALKDPSNLQYTNNRLFVIYLILNYTSVNDDTIISEFKISQKNFNNIKSNTELPNKFESKVKEFFEPLKWDGYLHNKLSVLHWQDDIQDGFEEFLTSNKIN
jgi:hypothetical protein